MLLGGLSVRILRLVSIVVFLGDVRVNIGESGAGAEIEGVVGIVENVGIVVVVVVMVGYTGEDGALEDVGVLGALEVFVFFSVERLSIGWRY